VAASVVVRAPLAAWLPLSGDEAYYWDCSRHLDWSYFDQPPLAIWAMVPFRALLGETALAVRAPTLLSTALIAHFLERVIVRLGGALRHAATAFLLLHATPLFFFGSGYASTDAVLMCAYLGATCAALAIAAGERRAWWGLGVALGLGFLGKFPSVLALAVLWPLLRQPQVRAHLRTPTPYLAALLAALLTAPVWIWSATNGWDDLAFHLHRVPAGFEPENVLGFWGAAALMVTPFLAAAMVLAWWRSRSLRMAGWTTFRVASATPLAFFSLLALRGHVGLHWAAPSLVLGVVPVVLVPFPWRRRLLAAGTITGVAAILVLLSVVALPRPWLAVETALRQRWGEPGKVELVDLFGLEEIAAEVARRLRPGELAASERYSAVHLVAFVTAGTVPTRLALLTRGRHGLGSLYWHRPEDLVGRDVLFFTERDTLEERLAARFDEIREDGPRLEVRDDGRVLRTVRFYRCRNLHTPAGAFSRAPGARAVLPASVPSGS
jgi:4-amino-4-deoxy-L-arabinose transferase-like glycosyltransferase